MNLKQVALAATSAVTHDTKEFSAAKCRAVREAAKAKHAQTVAAAKLRLREAIAEADAELAEARAAAWAMRGNAEAPATSRSQAANRLRDFAPDNCEVTVAPRKRTVTTRCNGATISADLETSLITARGYVPFDAAYFTTRMLEPSATLPSGWTRTGPLCWRYNRRRQVRCDLKAETVYICGATPAEVVHIACDEMLRLLGE